MSDIYYTDCQFCKHSHKWTDGEKLAYLNRFYSSVGRLPRATCDRFICDKIPKGQKWEEDGKTYEYDGYSLEGENYDEIFHCFEERE